MRYRKIFILALSSVLFAAFANAAEKTKLTLYYPVAVGGPLTKIINSMVDDFEKKNPDIDVNAIYAGNYNDARNKALTALNSGKPAQLAVMFSIDAYDLIEQDAIVPISDLVKTNEDKKWINSFYPALMENSTVLNKVWSVPFQRSTIIMYYNKDIFNQAGLDPENPPASWEELVDMGKKLTTKDHWGIMIPSTGYPYWMFGALAKQNGQVLMSKDGKRTFFDNPSTIEALEFWKDMGEKYKIMPKGMVEWGTLRKNFLEQKTAIMWHSTGNLSTVKKNAKFNFGVAMLPAKKTRGTPTGGGNFYIFKKTSPQEKAASLKFIKFMTSPENSAKWSKLTGYIGISEDAYKTPILQEYIKTFPAAKVARDQLKYATAEFSTYQTARVRKLLDDAIQSALSGDKTPKEALIHAQKQADSILKKYR